MFTLENTKKLKISLFVSFALGTFAFAGDSSSVDGAVKYPVKDGKYSAYHINTQKVKNSNIGRVATKNEITAWDVDVRPDGKGLPKFDMKEGKPVLDENGKPKIAQGSAEWGGELYEEKCAMCHGDFGIGGKGYPALSGGSRDTLSIQRLNPADENPNPDNPIKTIGTYWPYASTLFWYIKDSMPFPNPKTLSNSETYALTAFLLSANELEYEGEEIDDEFVLNREKMLKIKLPNQDAFYPVVDTKNPKDGVKNVTKFLADPKNYGKGERCMKDCIKGDVKDLVMRIKVDLSDGIQQKVSTKKSLPKAKKSNNVHPGKADYEAKCSACHANEAIGAPVVGNKEAWAEVTKKGIDAVYKNALNGKNAMPPKGGHMDTPDDKIKQIVDYMIEASK